MLSPSGTCPPVPPPPLPQHPTLWFAWTILLVLCPMKVSLDKHLGRVMMGMGEGPGYSCKGQRLRKETVKKRKKEDMHEVNR